MPFPGDRVALEGVDLIVADCVRLDRELTAALDASGAAVLGLAPGREFRWRLPGGEWHALALPPDVDWSRRLIAVYCLLGVRITDEQTLLPPRQRGSGIYVNPYAGAARKSLHPAFLRDVLAQFTDAPDAVDVVCPSPPNDVEDGERDAYAALDACVRDAAHGSARITVLPAMSVTEYVECIRAAGAVIGSDTSSQHVAALHALAEARTLAAEITQRARADVAAADVHGNVRIDQGTAANVIDVLAALSEKPAVVLPA